jgi:hypothetical protein
MSKNSFKLSSHFRLSMNMGFRPIWVIGVLFKCLKIFNSLKNYFDVLELFLDIEITNNATSKVSIGGQCGFANWLLIMICQRLR